MRSMQMFLIREGILDEKGINRLEKQVDDDLQVAVDRALQAPAPSPDKVLQYVYSPNLDPTSSAFDTQPTPSKPEAASDGKKTAPKTMENTPSCIPLYCNSRASFVRVFHQTEYFFYLFR